MVEDCARSIDHPQPAGLIIVGPRQLPREALQRLLEAASFTVLGGGQTFGDVLRQIKSGVKPDLVIYSFESDSSIEQELPQILEARAQFEEVRSVMLVDSVRPELLLSVLQVGVQAILSRDISSEVLRRSLELVLLGERIFPKNLVQMLLQRAEMPGQSFGAPLPPVVPSVADQQRPIALSPREQDILRCLVNGFSNKVIARELQIAEATVKVHVKALLRKTHMVNRTQAAIWALKNSFSEEPTPSGTGSTDTASLDAFPDDRPGMAGDLDAPQPRGASSDFTRNGWMDCNSAQPAPISAFGRDSGSRNRATRQADPASEDRGRPRL